MIVKTDLVYKFIKSTFRSKFTPDWSTFFNIVSMQKLCSFKMVNNPTQTKFYLLLSLIVVKLFDFILGN
jgi:hypothetical protein